MVLHKRLDYGFNGYQVPPFPRASRSARGRSLFKRKVDSNQMCAFELLATVAGNLLQEGENSQCPSNIEGERDQSFIVKDFLRQEQQDEEKPLEPGNPGSCDESVVVSDLSLQAHIQNENWQDSPHPKHDMGFEHSSISNSSCSEKFNHTEVVTGRKNEFMKLLRKIEGGSTGYVESCGNVVDGFERQLESETDKKICNVRSGTLPDASSSEAPMELDVKPPTLVCSESIIKVPHTSFLPFQTDVKLVCKDNDENFSGCTHPSTGNLKAFRPPPRIGDRRIRRLLASKYWKVAPKLNDREHSNYNDMRHVFRNTKACYMRQRSQRNSVFRRRKLFEHRLISKSEEETHMASISKSFKNNKDATGSASRASLVATQESSFRSRDSRVKLSIKSFRVPELFIEIPETATVGSLKRTVREAVTAILAGGLCIGVVLQGKKVRDDNKTLLQSGISHDDKLDALGFMLEPNPSPAPSAPVLAPQPLCQKDPPFLVSYDIPEPFTRYPRTPGEDPVSSDASPNPTLAIGGTSVQNCLNAVPSLTHMTAERAAWNPMALSANPQTVEPLAALPLDGNSRQSDLSQRRIRRPFSVSEVEILVQAVEKLGTGRWRDVKLWAFDNVEHRTYVDLKDKWKTLVHTARISPQQRRGEPVPQELLDRVLAAHARWSQQAKQQNNQQTENCLQLF